MKNKIFILTVTLLCCSLHVFSQRNFFVSKHPVMQCDTILTMYDHYVNVGVLQRVDTSILKLFWNVGDIPKIINGKPYYPFVLSDEEPTDTIGYIRYANRKIYLITNESGKYSKESVYFNFSTKAKKWVVETLPLNGHLKCIAAKYDRRYKERIYHFRILDPKPLVTIIVELYVGIKTGIVKVVFDTHEGFKFKGILKNNR
jgi:hypothetical protein